MRSKMRIAFGGVVVAAAMITVSTGAAAVNDIVFTANGVVTGGEGELRSIGQVTVPPELVGATCTGRAETQNQESAHPNNDLIITTGSTVAEIPDFESESFKTSLLTGTVVLGPTITFQVRIGPSFISSGVTVVLDCDGVAPPTTPPTTPAPLPPTTPAPVASPATAPPTTIVESAGPAPTAAAPAPTTGSASVAGAGALPATGSSSGPAILAATALIIAGAVLTLLRRRATT